MALKTFKPTTPAQRQLVIVDRSELWKGKPVKSLTEGKTKSGENYYLANLPPEYAKGMGKDGFQKVLKFIIYDDYSDIKIKIGRNGVWKRIF